MTQPRMGLGISWRGLKKHEGRCCDRFLFFSSLLQRLIFSPRTLLKVFPIPKTKGVCFWKERRKRVVGSERESPSKNSRKTTTPPWLPVPLRRRQPSAYRYGCPWKTRRQSSVYGGNRVIRAGEVQRTRLQGENKTKT